MWENCAESLGDFALGVLTCMVFYYFFKRIRRLGRHAASALKRKQQKNQRKKSDQHDRKNRPAPAKAHCDSKENLTLVLILCK